MRGIIISLMFFRRERPKTVTFSDHLDNLRKTGFTVASLPGGAYRISRGACAVDIKESNAYADISGRAGILMGAEIGVLVDGGYQKWFQTPSGKKKPALADDLKGLHDFDEDLKQSLGQTSLYNESLGTVSTLYLYDRVKDRDAGVPKRAWES
jgi:hypothetical protein